MSVELRIALVLTLLAAATLVGLVWRARTGRAKAIKAGQIVDIAELGATKDGVPVTAFGSKVTFLQFSSEMCSSCRQTAHQFSELEKLHPDLLHIEVDVTNRLDLANKFHILQTPTTLVLDSKGRVTSRIGGSAKPQTIADELESFHI